MTLIIGIRFKEGVILVSDRKVVDIGTMSTTWENKLQTPDEGKQLVVGAAGYSNLFNEFNRKIPLRVAERIREINIKNISILKQLGLDNPKKEKKVKPKKIQKSDIQELDNEEGKEDSDRVVSPYIYSNEDFIDDCKRLIRELCTAVDGNCENKLDVLLIMLSNTAKLHHIDFFGREEEQKYYAIGSGSEHIRTFLDEFLKSDDKSIDYLLKLAYFCIYYVQDLKLDNFVGMEEGVLPDHFVILNNGQFGQFQWKVKEQELIKEIRDKVQEFKKLKDSMKF